MAKSSEIKTPDNLQIWEDMRAVPETARRRIQGGHLNGKTDINPVWRLKMLTEKFGPVGFGWNVREVERWTNECAGEVGAFVKVELRVRIGDAWSEPIEGTGGSKLCGKGRGEGINDEAWKMATTDAISVACKSLGMAADIYYEKDAAWGSKYDPREMAAGAPRNSAPVNYTTRAPQGRQAPQNGPQAGGYGPGPSYASNGQPYQGQQLPRNPSKVCEVVDVQKGRARRLIAELAKYDYDDPDSWAAGLAWLRNEVVLREGAEALIVQLAIDARNNAQQQAVNQVFQK